MNILKRTSLSIIYKQNFTKNGVCDVDKMKTLKVGLISSLSYEALDLSCAMNNPLVENQIQFNKCMKKTGILECIQIQVKVESVSDPFRAKHFPGGLLNAYVAAGLFTAH